MSNIIPMEGKKFGRLLVIRQLGFSPDGSVIWECLCDCGASINAVAFKLRNGHTKSCGCLVRDLATKHGHNTGAGKSAEYHSWDAMKQRCLNPKHRRFIDWGGRGIKVCDRWLSFENFLQDMGLKPSRSHTIDRIDNDRNYEPSNCRWATTAEQAINKRVRKDSIKNRHAVIS